MAGGPSREEIIKKNFGGYRSSDQTHVGYKDMDGMGKFFASFLMMLTQAFNPSKADGDFGKGFMGILMKALGLENEGELQDLHDDIEKNGREKVRDRFNFSKMDRSAATEALSRGASLLAAQAPANPNERQQRVISVIGDAANAAGVSKEYMVGLWGFESSYGQNLKSNTGCRGDFQFTRATMVETIAHDGNRIAERLQARGLTEQAKLVQGLYDQTKMMGAGQIKQFAGNNARVVDTLSNNPEISAYAAAFYSRRVADDLKVDPNKKANFGIIYAGYNIGVGNAREIMAGHKASGWEVDANAGVARKGSAAEQATSYQRAIERGIDPALVKKVEDAQAANTAARTVVSAATQTDRAEKPAAAAPKTLASGIANAAKSPEQMLALAPVEKPDDKHTHTPLPQLAMLSMA